MFISNYKGSTSRCIGNVHLNLGKYTSALDYFIKSLEMSKSIFGKETVHPVIAGQHIDIGRVYVNMCKCQLALDHTTIALNMAEELYGKECNHIAVANCYINFVPLYCELGKYDINSP